MSEAACWMRRALALARQARPISAPNPAVGCVIVKDGKVLGEGFTQPVGSDHAEIQAIKDANRRGFSVEGATVYVTLEPCSHFGRTPPCALRTGTDVCRKRVGHPYPGCFQVRAVACPVVWHSVPMLPGHPLRTVRTCSSTGRQACARSRTGRRWDAPFPKSVCGRPPDERR